MARARSSFAISVDSDALDRLETGIHTGQRVFLNRTVKTLARNVAEKAPGGAGRSVGRSIYGRVLTDTVGAVGSNHPGAKALDRGAYISPKGGKKAVKFQGADGKDAFAKFVRLPARRYFARGLRSRNTVAKVEFERAMSGL